MNHSQSAVSPQSEPVNQSRWRIWFAIAALAALVLVFAYRTFTAYQWHQVTDDPGPIIRLAKAEQEAARKAYGP